MLDMTLLVVATGGTIASLADPQTGAVRPAVSAETLVSGVPGLSAFGPITVDQVDQVSGWNMTPTKMAEVASRIRDGLADASVDGVVVTHGTDTVEETAFLCDVTLGSDKPVVFAAAMRSGDELGSDGPRNLVCAARLACDPSARGVGTVLVMNDEIHAARWVRKRASSRLDAFASTDHGPIGFVTPDSVRMTRARPRRVVVGLPAALDHPVPIVSTYTGLETQLIEAVLGATGAAGLVLEGTGLGNLPESAEAGIHAALDRGLPVIVATRVQSGGTAAMYGGRGGGFTLRELGVIQAGTLSAAKARLLLMLLLAGGQNDVRERFTDAAQTLTAW